MPWNMDYILKIQLLNFKLQSPKPISHHQTVGGNTCSFEDGHRAR